MRRVFYNPGAPTSALPVTRYPRLRGGISPKMHVPKDVDALIPESQIRRPKFREEPPEIQCSRCDFGTGRHSCWRGDFVK